MKVNVYVDGFNFYYGAVRNTPYKWLDFSKLASLIFPNDNVHRIRYFTAHVSGRSFDPGQPVRQQTYLRALRTIPNLTIHLGHFQSKPTTMPLADPANPSAALINPATGYPQCVRVIKTEEKGSDVNIATYVLADGFRSDYDIVAVISNDSDLEEPIRFVRQELGLRVWLICPHNRVSFDLRRQVDQVRTLRPGALARCQFPPTLADGVGVITKPATW